MKQTSESKAKRAPFADLQRFMGLWLLRAAGFFRCFFAPTPDCVHRCSAACARIRFPRLVRRVLSRDMIPKYLTDSVKKSHLFTKRLEPIGWTFKPPGSLILHPPSSHAPSGYPHYLDLCCSFQQSLTKSGCSQSFHLDAGEILTKKGNVVKQTFWTFWSHLGLVSGLKTSNMSL